MRLTKYKQKRNFNNTTEPEGIIDKNLKDYNFVVQKHNARNLHYDFRLQHNGVLLSWAVPKGISLNPKIKRLAVKVEDHPVDYINFNGVIPKGNYGAGTVQIWDKGNYYPIKDIEKGLKNGELKFILNGEKLKGEFHLINTNKNQWLLFKSKDTFSINEENNKKLNPFSKISPQLCELTTTIPTGKDWLFETKFDGYRIIAFIENEQVKLYSRNNNDYTEKFKSITASLKKHFKNNNVVLDGEIIVADSNGKSNFGELQNSIKKGLNNFTYCIFDLLAYNGENLLDEKLIIRKELLNKLLKNSPTNLVFSEYVIGKGKQVFNLAKKLGLEGVVAKKINSKYSQTRSKDWLKIKAYLRQEFIILGYTKSDKSDYFASLILGYYSNNKLCYAGKVGTGFNKNLKQELNNYFKKIIRKTSPIKDEVDEKDAIFLKPELVAEIQFAEFTKSNHIRQGSFIGLRTDKSPKDVKLEKINE